MAVESNVEAAAVLSEGTGALDGLFCSLSPDLAEARGTIGGGAWSAKDLAGHIETWEEVALRTIEELRAGRRPSIDELVTDRPSMDLFNAGEVERKAGRTWVEALSGFRDASARLVAKVLAIPPQEWEATPLGQGGDARSLGQHVGEHTGMPGHLFRHAWAHLRDLEAFVKAVRAKPRG